MNAKMKTVVAVRRVGIMMTPNQPMYRRLLVDVMNEANRDHKVKGRCSRIQMDEVLNSGFDGMHKWSPMERSEHLMVARCSRPLLCRVIQRIGHIELAQG